MAMSGGSAEGEPMMDINTTPLIDVMLVLLIMFIITIPIQTHAVKLDLPQRVTVRGALSSGQPRLVFSIEEAWKINNTTAPAGALMAVPMAMLKPPPPGVGAVLTNKDISKFIEANTSNCCLDNCLVRCNNFYAVPDVCYFVNKTRD